jgi:putative transposase
MTLFCNKYRIESSRCQAWNYSSPGYYFVTTCTADREHLFGEITNAIMHLNEFGNIVAACWDDLPAHYPNMRPDAFVIMPNHVHMVINLVDGNPMIPISGMAVVETGLKPVSTTRYHGLSEIVRAFKSFSSRRINEYRKTSGTRIWQPRYHDRIVRNERELHRIRRYILNNPANWQNDQCHE